MELKKKNESEASAISKCAICSFRVSFIDKQSRARELGTLYQTNCHYIKVIKMKCVMYDIRSPFVSLNSTVCIIFGTILGSVSY